MSHTSSQDHQKRKEAKRSKDHQKLPHSHTGNRIQIQILRISHRCHHAAQVRCDRLHDNDRDHFFL